ncbi:hypothetical protein J6590_070283 [Homalodisca vitripennis]|nr:hypothetical protein J6590_070283 [Homalodisca vitripennis]
MEWNGAPGVWPGCRGVAETPEAPPGPELTVQCDGDHRLCELVSVSDCDVTPPPGYIGWIVNRGTIDIVRMIEMLSHALVSASFVMYVVQPTTVTCQML